LLSFLYEEGREKEEAARRRPALIKLTFVMDGSEVKAQLLPVSLVYAYRLFVLQGPQLGCSSWAFVVFCVPTPLAVPF